MSGSDLLKMIDEILDLSKVDAGKMEIHYEDVQLPDIEAFVEQNFAAVASRKHIDLGVHISEDIPQSIVTDSHRVKQILRNLLSNAFKFTNSGSVELYVEKADKEKLPLYLNAEADYVAFAVRDTGIGIPADKTDLIFEAFQQVDGTTSRKYGEPGLVYLSAASFPVCWAGHSG